MAHHTCNSSATSRGTLVAALAAITALCPPAAAQDEGRSIDLFEEHKDEYVQPDEPTLVEIGPAQYLVVEGTGAPEGEVFQLRISTLFSIAFSIKYAIAREEKVNFGVGTIEAQWWAEGFEGSFQDAPREQWKWKLLMRVPMLVTKTHLKRAVEGTKPNAEGERPAEAVKLETIEEGLCVQLLHKGPYADEPPNIKRMHEFAEAEGYEHDGPHHEIYLNNPQMTPPEKLKTILRQPVKKKKAEGERQ